MGKIVIEPATLRDATYITAHLRPLDLVECMCQMPAGTTTVELGTGMLMHGDAWVAKLDGQPTVFFGMTPSTAPMVHIWAVGTKDTRRCIPRVSDHFFQVLAPYWLGRGYVLGEARSIVEHKQAHRWMKSLGAEQVGGAFPMGRDGEQFLLFRWTADAMRERMKRLRGGRYRDTTSGTEEVEHVQGTEDTGSAGR
jgi:hypothetical protein